MLPEGQLQSQFCGGVLFLVKMHHVIKAQAMGACHKAIYRNVFLQSAGCAKADNTQAPELRFNAAGRKINIGQRIYFIQRNINIIRPDTGADHRKAQATDVAGMGNKLPVLPLYFNTIKMSTHFLYSIRITHQ